VGYKCIKRKGDYMMMSELREKKVVDVKSEVK